MLCTVQAIKGNAKVLKDTKSVCARLTAYLNARFVFSFNNYIDFTYFNIIN